MNFSQADLPLLKWSLFAFTLSLVIASSAIWLSSKYVDQARKERQQAQQQLINARKKLGDAQGDLANMAIYSREFATLLENKIIGGEQRLDWMEELDKLRQQRVVFDFKYTITPQQPYIPSPTLDSGNFELKLSGLSLQLDLVHEMQLIRLLDALRANVKGWFIIDHCSMERSSANAAIQLKAECVGGWITMQKKTSP